jgi:pyrroloquinoline quinone (PQQ) biosynthesis protein C
LDPHFTDLCGPDSIRALDEVPFLDRCRQGTVTPEELRAFLVQQYFYSRHFTRYLCALLSNITNDADRSELIHNLLEEMGFSGGKPHAQIYASMMAKMGCDPVGESIHPATQELINGMFDCCRDGNPMVGLGALCLGAEAIVPHVYSQVVEGFRSVGETDDRLEFFLLHIESDDEHALTMRRIIEKELAVHPEQRSVLQSAARRIIAARRRFFEAIGEVPAARVPVERAS